MMFVCCRFFGGVCLLMFVDCVTRDGSLKYVSRTKCISMKLLFSLHKPTFVGCKCPNFVFTQNIVDSNNNTKS